MIKKMKEEKDVILYCDFHGHSRKKNSFMCNYSYFLIQEHFCVNNSRFRIFKISDNVFKQQT